MSTSYHTQLIQKIQRTDYGQRAASQLLPAAAAVAALCCCCCRCRCRRANAGNDNENSSRQRCVASRPSCLRLLASASFACLGYAIASSVCGRTWPTMAAIVCFRCLCVVCGSCCARHGCIRLVSVRLGTSRFASLRFATRQSLPVDCDVSTWRTAEQHAVRERVRCCERESEPVCVWVSLRVCLHLCVFVLMCCAYYLKRQLNLLL